MADTMPDDVSTEYVRAAAASVDLHLGEGDAEQVAALLSQWMPAAKSLSARMQAGDLDRLGPITAFTGSDHVPPTMGVPS
ncbi:hypothetical protein [Rhodococcoides fascians]|jgi:hypothetical protein|uniref:hypothetical protein n=1 Tax=Rhodococcoides fascians TaxID=1828 RepID=UPI001D6F1B05|nr:hypothetical protein [Rhodococcus fascians]CAH0310660.1 hypothetical protein SRABI91_04919 [Rhodococcus fascians]